MFPMVIGFVIGYMACQKAALTIINEVGTEIIVAAKIMFPVGRYSVQLRIFSLFIGFYY